MSMGSSLRRHIGVQLHTDHGEPDVDHVRNMRVRGLQVWSFAIGNLLSQILIVDAVCVCETCTTSGLGCVYDDDRPCIAFTVS